MFPAHLRYNTGMRILVVFLDGVGVGPDDAASNPFLHARLPILRDLLGGTPPLSLDGCHGLIHETDRALLLGVDATLGVPDLPQSATGQTALLTGLNAPRRLGYHYGPYPNQMLRDLLAEHSLFRQLLRAGQRVAFANAYPERYHERLTRGKGRASAIARAAHLAGVRLRGPEDLRAGHALSAFLTNRGWREYLGYRDMPIIEVAEAGRRLARLAQDYDFTLFEYYHTDIVGHRGVQARILEVLEEVDGFLGGVVEHLGGDTLLVVVSDHGNVEDWCTTKHTRNPALALFVGDDGPWRRVVRRITKLTDVAPAVLEIGS